MKKLFLLSTFLLFFNVTSLIAAGNCSKDIITGSISTTSVYRCGVNSEEAENSAEALACEGMCTGSCDDEDTGKRCGLSATILLNGVVVANETVKRELCEYPPCVGNQKCWKVGIRVLDRGLICHCGCLGGREGEGNLVKLANFTATPTDKGISLNWNTKTEVDSQGFRMWRAIPDLNRYCGCSENIENYTQVQVLDKEGKPVLISARGNETAGFDYSYLDQEAKPGIAYCYALEDINSKGESKFYFEYVAFTPDGLPKEKR